MPQVVPFIGPVMGLGGAIGGMLGQRKQQKQQAVYAGKAMGNLGAMGDTGLANMNKASGAYEGMLDRPEEWTGGTAADLAKQSQQQAGTLARTVGRSGMAGASARDLLTQNTAMNMRARLAARQGALSGMTNLAQIGEQANRGLLGGSQGQGYLNLAQNQQSSDIFGSMGGSLYDIFSKLPKKGGGMTGGDWSSIGDIASGGLSGT